MTIPPRAHNAQPIGTRRASKLSRRMLSSSEGQPTGSGNISGKSG